MQLLEGKKKTEDNNVSQQFFGFFYFSDFFFFFLEAVTHGNCQNNFLYKNQPLSSLNLDALQCKSTCKTVEWNCHYMQYFCSAVILKNQLFSVAADPLC